MTPVRPGPVSSTQELRTGVLSPRPSAVMDSISANPRTWQEIQTLAELLAGLPGASVILLGSAARGELAEGVVAGQHEVFSDYEFMVVTSRRMPYAEQRRIRQAAEAVARGFGYRNPLFHVDVAFRERDRLPRLPRTIFTFELKCNGRVVCGPDVRDLIPYVGLNNLDWGDTNELLYRRLWAIMLYMPADFARGAADELTEVTMSYLLARNALDLSTALLPHQGVLLPTYCERVTYLEKRGLVPTFSRLGEAFVPFLGRCLEERRSLSFSESARIRYPILIAYLAQALDLIGLDSRSPESSSSPFNEWPRTRGQWLHLAKVFRHLAVRYGPVKSSYWLRQPLKAMRVVGHLHAHRALIAWHQGDAGTADEELTCSWSWLHRLMPEAESATHPTGPFHARWLALREMWRTYWNTYNRMK